MLPPYVKKTCEDIKSLKIQGAREIAKAAVRAIVEQAEFSDAKTNQEFIAHLIEAADALAATRPTEPLLRNAMRDALRFMFAQIKKSKTDDVATLKKKIKQEASRYEETMRKNKEKISEYGAKLLPKKCTLLLHCHSTTVVAIVKRADEMGKDIRVICTETRPRFQGRMTALELRDAGFDVTLIVDSAVKAFMKEIDFVLVGADAITSTGELVNKIGTYGIATLAYYEDIPFYSAAETHKFDPLTLWGNAEEIEERDPSEVADPKEFRGIKIRNPAFDVTPAKYIRGYITEIGIIPAQGMLNAVIDKFGLRERD
ncbi:MAG: S-methyl-5-thioribose-1-phosphate isomerase [Candidatus Micrarchaeia archaeon]